MNRPTLRKYSQTVLRCSALTVAGVASLLLSGCGSGTVNSAGATAAQLRIIDASVDAGGLDIYASNSVLAYNLGFGTITSYIPMTPGTYKLEADLSSSRTAVATANATLSSSKQYTLLLGNVLAGLQATVLQDASSPAPSGQINIRFLDEATRVGAVDVYMVPSGATLLTVNPILTNLTFGSNTRYLNVPVGTYKVYVVAAGTVITDTTVPLFSGASVTYPTGCARTIVLLDQQIVTQPGVQVITANDYDSATATN